MELLIHSQTSTMQACVCVCVYAHNIFLDNIRNYFKWVNTGSGNGLLPDGTKPLPEPMLNSPHWGVLEFTRGQEMQKTSIHRP